MRITANRKTGLTVKHYTSTLAGTTWKNSRITAQFSQVSPVLFTSENKELKIYAIKFDVQVTLRRDKFL